MGHPVLKYPKMGYECCRPSVQPPHQFVKKKRLPRCELEVCSHLGRGQSGVHELPHSDRKEEPKIMRKAPWHSVLQHVHHDNTSCTEGNNIERENLRQGTGGKPLCDHCQRLDNTGR